VNGHNPILPISYCIPDGEAHVMPDGSVYLYGSLDKGREGFCSGQYLVASSSDMKNWTVTEEPSFTAQNVPWAASGVSRAHSSLSGVKRIEDLPQHIQAQLPLNAGDYPIEQIIAAIEKHAEEGLPKDVRLYAPDAIYKNGKYYLYFCLSDDSEGVAVSESPNGPVHGAAQLPVSGIDPAVFVDDDGSAYYYWGQFSANAARLTPDMRHLEEASIVEGILTEKEHHFHEGSSVRKRGNTYYYVFADTSRGRPCCLGYATSNSPLGPFTYQGVIIDNGDCDPKCWNIHGSIEEVNGQWYVFYHRSSNNSQYLRRACCEPIFFDANGLIPEVRMSSQGGGEPLRPRQYIPANLACSFDGWSYLDTESNPDGVAQLKPGGSAFFRYVVNEEPLSRAVIDGIGDSMLSILSDGALVGQGKSAAPVAISLAPGKHEISIQAEAEPFVLLGFHLE